jgi:tetratricopeptide (TPR) repeat protein
MMKKLTLGLSVTAVPFFLAIFLGACSSSPTKVDSAADNSNYHPAAPTPMAEDNTVDVIPEKEKVKATVVVSQYEALNDAIKTQNDEKIYTSSTAILSQSPTDLKALNAIAMYNYKKGRFEVARYLLAKALNTHQRSSELYSNLGIVQLAQNERRDAIKSFRQALDINNGDSVASANLGAIYVQEKDYNKALIVLETAYKKGMRDSRIAGNYAVALAANKNFAKAEEIYQSALKDQNGNKELLFNYAILLIDDLNKNQEGLDVLNRLKFVGSSSEMRNRINALEIKAKAGVK